MVVHRHIQHGLRQWFFLLVPLVLMMGCQTTLASKQRLTASQRAEVWAAFEAYAAEDGVPLESAAFGIRFSDVPRAADTAARATEMAIVSIDHGETRSVINLLTLNSQPASIEVQRCDPPEVLRVSCTVGLFPNAAAAQELNDALFEALRAWGAVKRFSE